ncbi:hypothetical protein TRFO_08283 [Tritrichomonas foetus]|uniref:Bromo domain-containing protein n=1 Tax=Tritrichomonas foetus TaxID=1144522 RepID=A0A1J4JKP9_9EUKA|nr:hypothetical protein TRFO_08283 [Tritrichomonas foetus]|eukprot:OHS99658.1 hypothetical protein TRFO_08283 [Tritrichomonas foetus]
MPLSSQRKARCITIIDELLKNKISRIFADPVDPELDNCPNYLDIIKRPMDLGTVRANLVNDRYDKFSDFCADVDQIWENAREFNGEYSMITLFAQQLKKDFDSKIFLMTDDEVADWITKFYDLQNQMWNFATRYTNAPEQRSQPAQSVQPQTQARVGGKGIGKKGAYKDYDNYERSMSSNHSEHSSSRGYHVTSSSSSSVKSSTPAFSTGTSLSSTSKSGMYSNSPIHSINSLNNSNMVNDSPSHSNYSSISSSYKKQPPKKPEKKITAEELIELHNMIKQLESEESVFKVLNIIKTHEHMPELTEKSVVDLNNLSMKTRVKLYEWIQNNGYI